jgi:hypothetical protein
MSRDFSDTRKELVWGTLASHGLVGLSEPEMIFAGELDVDVPLLAGLALGLGLGI